MSEDFSDLEDLEELDSASTDWKSLIKSFSVPIFLGLFGLVFIGIGIYMFIPGVVSHDSGGIEVLEADTGGDRRKIFVEIIGAVNSPGVYEVDIDTRVNDLISLSGGFTDEADTEWVERVLNRASFVEDGQKIIIPSVDQSFGNTQDKHSTLGSATENGSDQNVSADQGSGSGGLVNINTATPSELEALWGIGPVTGQNIIDQRPYSSVDDLLSRKILKSNVYERNKDLLTVF